MRHPSPLPTRAVEPSTILVVDGDRKHRLALERLLGAGGYSVVSAASAPGALGHARRRWLDLVIMDLDLEGGDGYQLTEAIRHEALNRHVPIMLMASQASTKRFVAGLDRGADDFLPKPADVDELLARVRVHLRHAAEHHELLRRSTHDALTGVLNRGAIEEELARELRRMHRTGLSVSVLMADIDRFKTFNDRYGHAIGDAALAAVARSLARLLRRTDRLGRFGGDEFLAVLPDTSGAQAGALERRVRVAWRQHPAELPELGERISISIGSATAMAGESIEALMRRADAAMYRDKRRHVARGQALGAG